MTARSILGGILILGVSLWASCSPGTGAKIGDADDGISGTSGSGNGSTNGNNIPGTYDGGGFVLPDSGGGSRDCIPRTCEELGASCGPIGDGCGEIVDCGGCPDGESCGGGGVPSQCGSGVACTPQTCEDVGANCGPVADGCGALTPSCGTCTGGAVCGAEVPNRCGGASGGSSGDCTGLCTYQVACSGGGATTLTGKVYAPNGNIPLYNAIVYVPNATPPAIPEGASCDRCEGEELGNPIAAALTAPDGSFELRHIPAGVSFPLVIKMGKWRRIVTIPSIQACTTLDLPATHTRLPRNRSEGHIPKIAVSTGRVDALECVLRKAGIDASEFTRPDGDGRIHLYRADLNTGARGGAWPDQASQSCGSCGSNNAIHAARLYESQPVLDSYDMIAFGCEASERSRSSDHRNRLRDYVNKGGRLFLSHFHYDWIHNTSPLDTTAVWGGGNGRGSLSDPTDAIVDGSFPKGAAFIEWLDVVNASRGTGMISIDEPRRYVRDTTSASQRWIYTSNSAPYNHGENSIQHFTFNTPVGASDDDMCGRVVYSAFHVSTGRHDNAVFPNHCTGPLDPQEKVLLFMIFDLSACVTPDSRVPPPPATCTPSTCDDVGAECGLIGDGCGGIANCGNCPPGQACGIDAPNQCGTPPADCEPLTCAQQNADCGPIGDGCGNIVECGDCPPGETCGGGGVPHRCGSPQVH